LAFARRSRVWPLVGLYQDTPVGFGQLARWRNTAEIADLVVGKHWQSYGIGTAIVSQLVELAREQGFAHVEIGVAESNTRAYTLYRHLGFTQLENRLLLDLGQGPEPILYLSRLLDERHD
jgi:ribosomal-protein-alanine N-acetyltransferase